MRGSLEVITQEARKSGLTEAGTQKIGKRHRGEAGR